MYLSSLLPCLTAVVLHAVLCWERKLILNADSTVKHAVAKDTGGDFLSAWNTRLYKSLILPANDNFALKRFVRTRVLLGVCLYCTKVWGKQIKLASLLERHWCVMFS